MKRVGNFVPSALLRKRAEELPPGETLEYLFAALHYSLPALFVACVAYASLIYDAVPSSALWIWLALVTLLIFVRHRYHNARISIPTERARQSSLLNSFVLYALATAFLVGIGGPIFVDLATERVAEVQLISLLLILGVSAGAATAMYIHYPLMVGYLLLLQAPLFLASLLDRRYEHGPLYAAILGMFFLSMLIFTWQSSRFVQMIHRQKRKLDKQRNFLKVRSSLIEALFEQAPIPILYYDSDLRVKKINKKLCEMSGGECEKYENLDLRTLKFAPIQELLEIPIREQRNFHYIGPYQSTYSENEEFWIEAYLSPIFDDGSRPRGGLAVILDKTEEKRANDRLRELADKDTLTNLFNRRYFMEALTELVTQREKSQKHHLLFFIDLNHFKQYNDTLGHLVGDEILVEVARRLRDFSEEKGILGRVGGDEFALLYLNASQNADDARKRGEKIVGELIERFQNPIRIGNYSLQLGISVGVVVVSPSMRDPIELIRYADISMYQAKRSRLPYAFYTVEMDNFRQHHFFLQHGLKKALENGELRVYFQPIVSIAESRLCAAEALVRWAHPTQGAIPAESIISTAVKIGAIDEVGRWVLEEACRSLRSFERDPRMPELEYISVNVDARQFVVPGFLPLLLETVRRYDIEPHRMMLEVTESSLIENYERMRQVIRELEEAGVRRAIDDFGTGYSSLAYLEDLDFDTLKMDRKFTENIVQNQKTKILVRHILSLAQELGYQVIVEGIEQGEELEEFRRMVPQGCYQGFFYSKPLERNDFVAAVHKTASGSGQMV